MSCLSELLKVASGLLRLSPHGLLRYSVHRAVTVPMLVPMLNTCRRQASKALPSSQGYHLSSAASTARMRPLQVVLSRALAVPGPEGVIVPMLVPMVDMLNHAGNETAMLLSDEARPMDNVR